MQNQIVDWQNTIAASALPPMARHLAHVLALHFLRGIPAVPSQSQLERQMGIVKNTLKNALHALDKAGVIRIEWSRPVRIWPVLDCQPLTPNCQLLTEDKSATVSVTDSPVSAIDTPPCQPLTEAGLPQCQPLTVKCQSLTEQNPPSPSPHTPYPLPPEKTFFSVADMPAQERSAYNRRDPFELNPANCDADRLLWWGSDGRLYAAPAMEAEISAALPGRPLRNILDEIAGWIPGGCQGLTLLTKVRSQIAKQADFAARRAAADQAKIQTPEKKRRDASYVPWV